MLQSSLQVFSIDGRTPENVLNVNVLQTAAATRGSLKVLSMYIDENYTSNMQELEKLPTFLEVARNLCTGENRSAIRLFLLKQLVRKYGIGTTKERCQNEELQWILPVHNQVSLKHLKMVR